MHHINWSASLQHNCTFALHCALQKCNPVAQCTAGFFCNVGGKPEEDNSKSNYPFFLYMPLFLQCMLNSCVEYNKVCRWMIQKIIALLVRKGLKTITIIVTKVAVAVFAVE